MLSNLLQVSLLVAGAVPAFASPLIPRAAAVDELVGYGAGTTGGGSGAGTTVTSCATLTTALGKGGVVKVKGLLDGCGILLVPSDTTVIGVGAGSGLKNGGLRLKKVNNVILRNLKLDTAPKKGDLVDIEGSTQVWVDHCEFSSVGLVGGKDDYDGLLDLKAGSDKITISWTKFHDHWKGSLVGHSDNNASKDSGKLHVTYHHNDWKKVNSRTPSVRFGTAHVYSSCYTDIPTSGVHPRMGAQALVEQNHFTNVQKAIVTNIDSKEDGFAVEKGNIYDNSTKQLANPGTLNSVPYKYTTDAAAQVCAIVAKSAGTGIVA